MKMKCDNRNAQGIMSYHCHSPHVVVAEAARLAGDSVAFWATRMRDATYSDRGAARWQMLTADLQRQNAYRDLIRGVKHRSN